MSRRISRSLLALASIVVVSLALAASPVAAAPRPTVSLSRTSLAPGDTVDVSGQAWHTNVRLRATVCGNQGLDGDLDCDGPGGVVFVPWSDGTLHAKLRVTVPPAPCPCVVRVVALEEPRSVDVPIQLAGVPVAPVRIKAPIQTGSPAVSVESVRVVTRNTVGALFGAPARRTLVVQLKNLGTAALQGITISAAWGRGESPSHVIDAGRIPTVLPGQMRTVELRFEINSLSVGRYVVVGSIAGPTAPVSFRATTNAGAWVLDALAGAVLGAAVVTCAWHVRARARRRARRRRLQRCRARIERARLEQAPGSEDAMAALETHGFVDLVAEEAERHIVHGDARELAQRR